MSNKIAILILAIVLIIIAGIVVYFFASQNFSFINKEINNSTSQNTNLPLNKKIPTAEEQAAQIKKDYPETIRGIINFLDKGKIIKTTIKADDNKEYTLWPPQPSSIYESFGVKNGQRVELSGRLNDKGNLEWATLKTILKADF